ncbi:amino acid carrier protein [Candidatus Paracaedibacter symbiosus]|uniref:amino acid carrier protein n=1 Tax=Candidatus Paracaedibacter symbiosus TaxID=244582 RepID=UPI00050951D3|nr:amino acid carrier protein [Candidatus Paracaedibacter symbiosus]
MSYVESFFIHLRTVDDFFWSYIGFTLVVSLGLYFTLKTKFYQFRTIGKLKQTIKDLHHESKAVPGGGIHPIRLYFASVGGMVGLGNVVGIITALIIGGPGSLFWLWIASFSGMLIKYAEIYLGIHFRMQNSEGSYDGGPMYYLRHAFKSSLIPAVVAVLLCIYGVEVYQFVIITDTLSQTFALPKFAVMLTLVGLTLYTAIGGVNRLASVCSILMPGFMIGYMAMCLWVIGCHFEMIPGVLATVVKSAFTGHAAIGGFAGSTLMLAAQNGIARAVYSGDIGIGYDSTIQSETKSQSPEKQARLAIFSLLTDSVICSLSILVVLVTDLWHKTPALLPSEYVAAALGMHFPYINIFMAVFFFLAGFTTILAFFTVGMKCAKFLSNTWGERLYLVYGACSFIFFSFFDQSKVILIMSVSGGLLMLINMVGIVKLRDKIYFK